MINASNIKEFSASDLVAEYNMLTGKSIKKFQDRATAERRLIEVLGSNVHVGPAIKRAAKSASRAASIAASWNDKNVAEKRAVRHAVRVSGGRIKDNLTFKSVAEAFRTLHLPMGKHIKFRGELFFSGTATIGDYTFTLAN